MAGGSSQFDEPVGQARPVSSLALPQDDLADLQPEAAESSDSMLLASSSRGQAALDVLLLVSTLLLSMFIIGVMAGLAQGLFGETDKRWLQVIGLPIQAAAWLAIVFGVLQLRKQSRWSIGFSSASPLLDGAAGLLTWGLAFVAWVSGMLLVWLLWPSGYEALQKNTHNIKEMLPRLHPVFLVMLQMVVAVYEEVVFRGFLMTRLRRVFGSWTLSVVVTSLVFAVPHVMNQELAAVVPLFLLGCALSAVTIWRRSLVPAMMGHAFWNSGTLLVLYYQSPDWR